MIKSQAKGGRALLPYLTSSEALNEKWTFFSYKPAVYLFHLMVPSSCSLHNSELSSLHSELSFVVPFPVLFAPPCSAAPLRCPGSPRCRPSQPTVCCLVTVRFTPTSSPTLPRSRGGAAPPPAAFRERFQMKAAAAAPGGPSRLSAPWRPRCPEGPARSRHEAALQHPRRRGAAGEARRALRGGSGAGSGRRCARSCAPCAWRAPCPAGRGAAGPAAGTRR